MNCAPGIDRHAQRRFGRRGSGLPAAASPPESARHGGGRAAAAGAPAAARSRPRKRLRHRLLRASRTRLRSAQRIIRHERTRAFLTPCFGSSTAMIMPDYTTFRISAAPSAMAARDDRNARPPRVADDRQGGGRSVRRRARVAARGDRRTRHPPDASRSRRSSARGIWLRRVTDSCCSATSTRSGRSASSTACR